MHHQCVLQRIVAVVILMSLHLSPILLNGCHLFKHNHCYQQENRIFIALTLRGADLSDEEQSTWSFSPNYRGVVWPSWEIIFINFIFFLGTNSFQALCCSVPTGHSKRELYRKYQKNVQRDHVQSR